MRKAIYATKSSGYTAISGIKRKAKKNNNYLQTS